MKHEKKKLRALLSNPKEYVEDYELRGDNGDYTPNKNEQFLMKDCLIGYEEECFNALKDKVILKEDLLMDLKIVACEIQEEIDGRAGYPNIGKIGCLKRINKLIEKYNAQNKKAGI